MRSSLLFIILILFISCENNETLFESRDQSSTGLDFENQLTESDDFNILDYLYFYNGGGVAIGDINSDGLPDIYLSGNQVKNKLFLNKGDLQFEDITDKAGVAGASDWNTGAVMGDINGDGHLDIYVCAVVGLRGLAGHNELFINNGDNTFTERAAEFELDFDSYSSSASFLDYDLDGDLDIFLLNHAIHTQESFGHADLRLRRSYETGDKLLRNDGSVFQDVSEEAGIFGGVNGYGLGMAVSDFNQDGYPDIYVGNDFHEDDYFYVNNGNGTFSEKLKDSFGQTSRFTMGCDVTDINHDGLPDLLTLDMLPADEKVLKSSEGDDDVNVQRLRIQKYGYHYQFSRNMLQVNLGNEQFSEVALMSKVAATDWSWSSLFADFNQDGEQDIFISNGIPKRPNDLDYIKFVSNEQIQGKIDATKLVDQQALDLMPSGAVSNIMFKGTESLSFEDKSAEWIPNKPAYSTATAMGDLDNDGDLDLVVNNINGKVSLYENQTKGKYIKLTFDYTLKNKFGIGTKVYSYHQGKLQYKELYTARGFQSSMEPIIHFGYGNVDKVDSIRIVWPDQTTQLLREVSVNQTLNIIPENVTQDKGQSANKKSALFEKVEGNLGINFEHVEDRYIDFDRQKLIPYQISDRGPAVALGDLNNDGKTDIFFGGSKLKTSKIFVQSANSFEEWISPVILLDSIKEDVYATIEDFNEDGRNDLLVGSGGSDFYNNMKPLLDSYYVQTDSGFVNQAFPEFFENASVIVSNDFDKDGDLDVFVGNQNVSGDFGRIPNSYLLRNDAGQFSIIENENLSQVGMITDAIWDDYDNDGDSDLIVVGEWMTPTFFSNDDGVLVLRNLVDQDISGLWQSIIPFDIDGDGDSDYLMGNWGQNSKFDASQEYPMTMYYADFDDNESTETVLATAKNGKYYTLEGFDGLASQMEELKKKYRNYSDFAGETIEEVFGDQLKMAKKIEVKELRSGYLKNEEGQFTFVTFPESLQIAPITSFVTYDFDGDGKEDALAGGNYFGVKPFHGRLGSFPGALIKSESEVWNTMELGLDFINKSIRNLNIISLNESNYLIATINNSEVQVYKLTK